MAAPTSPLKLGLRLEVYRAAELKLPIETIRQAEALGYHSVWTAEAYGTDALTPLAYIAALTERIKLGTAIAQVAARPPTTLAMHAMTHRRAGRAAGGSSSGSACPDRRSSRAGTASRGASRTRGCATTSTILRKTLDREGPVAHDGPGDLAALPRPGRARPGQGAEVDPAPGARASRSGSRRAARATSSSRPSLPTAGCRWASARAARLSTRRRSSRASPAHGTAGGRTGSTSSTGSPCNITDDVRGALDAMRAADRHVRRRHGQRDAQLPPRGHGPARVSRRGGRASASCWRAGRKEEAIAAVPDEYLEQTTLLGSPQRIRAALGARRGRARGHRRDRRRRPARGARADGRARRVEPADARTH